MKKAPTLPPAPASVPEALVDLIAILFLVTPDQITKDASLALDLGADELDIVEFGMNLEETFGIELTDADEETLETATVADILKLLARHEVAL
jgi:acyl carrier protein